MPYIEAGTGDVAINSTYSLFFHGFYSLVRSPDIEKSAKYCAREVKGI